MGRTVQVAKRRRGFFGQVAKWLFIAFNALMLLWLILVIGAAGEQDFASDAEAAGYALGTGIGVFAIAIIWVIGDIILGLPVLMTRGEQVIVERDE